MLLRRLHAAFVCSLAVCAFFAPGKAKADTKQCIAQNNDGAQLRDDHHLLAARDAYRACLAEPKCPEMVRSECDAALADLKAVIPSLRVAVVDGQGHDVSGATLQVDGRTVVIDGSTLEVDPGAHELRAGSGSLSTRLDVMALESDANRRVEIVLQAPAPKPEPVTTPPATRATWPVFALGGVAALGAGSFAYFALSGHADKNHLDECKPYCDASDVRRVRNEYNAADISLGVSLVALVGAGYWLFSAPKAVPDQVTRGVSLGFSARTNAAGLSLRWVD